MKSLTKCLKRRGEGPSTPPPPPLYDYAYTDANSLLIPTVAYHFLMPYVTIRTCKNKRGARRHGSGEEKLRSFIQRWEFIKDLKKKKKDNTLSIKKKDKDHEISKEHPVCAL